MKKLKTLVAGVILATTILAMSPIGANAVLDGTHWLKTGNEWKYQIGAYYFTKWNNVKGSWYYFSKDTGLMLHDTYTPDGYYVGPDGRWIPNYSQSAASINVTDTVSFADCNLEAVVRAEINKPTGVIYKSDVASITNLEIRNANVSTLDGIDNLINLTGLGVIDNEVYDVSSVKYLTKLEYLGLKSMKLTSNQIIDVVTPLCNLKHLGLYGNNFTYADKQRLADANPNVFTDYLTIN